MREINVKNFHINDIFNKAGKVNVLNIDIEGQDFEVIKSANLKIIDPDVILIESEFWLFSNKRFKRFFLKNNYLYIFSCGPTKCFA